VEPDEEENRGFIGRFDQKVNPQGDPLVDEKLGKLYNSPREEDEGKSDEAEKEGGKEFFNKVKIEGPLHEMILT